MNLNNTPAFEDIVIAARREFDEQEKELILKAYNFAKSKHKGQYRKLGPEYFSHVAHAGLNAARFGMDATTIAAAILHDTVEDTETTVEEITENFNQDIAFLVDGVTKLSPIRYQDSQRNVESLRKLFVASAQDLRVVIIKLADRLHNIQTLEGVNEQKRKRIALETIEIFAQLAWRLGMSKVANELQDHAFPYAFPKEFQETEKLLKQRKKINQKYIEKVYKTLLKEMTQNGIRYEKIDYRIKNKYSLYRKLVRKNMDIEKVYDIVALRIIVPDVNDCYRLLGIIHTVWKPFPGRVKDYIALPKPNGYRSLHTTIFTGDGGVAEIQIRTSDMHEYAEYGIASHLGYKQKGPSNMPSFDWLQDLKNLNISEKKPNDFIKNLKADFFNDRIFALTPRGDVIDLPRGSSVLDFAYAIHSEIGNKTVGARINGKYSSIKTKLKNNDVVEIETKDNAKPSSKWLEYVSTTMARKHVQKYLRDHSYMTTMKSFFGKSGS